MAYKILIVGAGITGAVTSALLRQTFREQAKLVIWDKAKGFGGRMSTSRSPEDSKCLADLGAQYITSSKENFLAHKDIYNDLIVNNLLEPLSANVDGMQEFFSGAKHFVAPEGMSSLVKHLFKDVADETCFNQHICTVTQNDKKWVVGTESGHQEVFDIVILTMPVPQILNLSGGIIAAIANNREIQDGLNAVKYSSRYALALFYSDDCGSLNMSWDMKYITNDEIFRYVAFDNKKRNRPGQLSSIVFHTSVPFGTANIEKSVGDIQPLLMSHIKKIFPTLPEATSVKCQKWRYSQVVSSYPERPGYATLVDQPLLIAGGDGFSTSNFDGCIYSALKVAEEVVKLTGVSRKNNS